MTIKEVQYIINRPLFFFFAYKVLLSQIKFFLKSSSNAFITKHAIKVDICLKATPKLAGLWFPVHQEHPEQHSPLYKAQRRCTLGLCAEQKVLLWAGSISKLQGPQQHPSPVVQGFSCPHKSVSVADSSSSKGAPEDTSAPNTILLLENSQGF